MMPPQQPMPGPLKLDPFSQEALDRDRNKYGKQAYLCAHDRRFAAFASERNPDATFDYLHHSEEFISKECGVQALRFIDDTPEAIAKWQELKAQYDAWLAQTNTV